MPYAAQTPPWSHLLPLVAQDSVVTRDDLEKAVWVITGWDGDPLYVEELLLIADAYAKTYASGDIDVADDPTQVRRRLLDSGWVPTGPLPVEWVRLVEEATQKAARSRDAMESGTVDQESILGLAGAVETLCTLVRQAMDSADVSRETPIEFPMQTKVRDTVMDAVVDAFTGSTFTVNVSRETCPEPEPEHRPALGAVEALPHAEDPERTGAADELTVPTPRPAVGLTPVEGVDRMVNGAWMRVCTRCGVDKVLRTEYHKDTKGMGGRSRACRECKNSGKRQHKK